MNRKLVGAVLGLLVACPALAGPPIMCNAIDIGDAKSLPMGEGALTCSSSCSAGEAEEQALAVLKKETSALVHMETLRRATVYVAKDKEKARGFFSRVMAAALDAQAGGGDGAALAMFDAGFLAACYGEMGVELGWSPGAADGVQGYAWVKSGIEKLASGSAQKAAMEYGAALVTHPLQHTQAYDAYKEHIKLAEAGGKDDPTLAKNLKAYHAKMDVYIKQAVEDGRIKSGAAAKK